MRIIEEFEEKYVTCKIKTYKNRFFYAYREIFIDWEKKKKHESRKYLIR